jgi:hypothetical protein
MNNTMIASVVVAKDSTCTEPSTSFSPIEDVQRAA